MTVTKEEHEKEKRVEMQREHKMVVGIINTFFSVVEKLVLKLPKSIDITIWEVQLWFIFIFPR